MSYKENIMALFDSGKDENIILGLELLTSSLSYKELYSFLENPIEGQKYGKSYKFINTVILNLSEDCNFTVLRSSRKIHILFNVLGLKTILRNDYYPPQYGKRIILKKYNEKNEKKIIIQLREAFDEVILEIKKIYLQYVST